MTREEALKAIEYAKERAEVIREQGQSEYWAQEINWTIEAIDMAIEALKREDTMPKEIERVVLYGERSKE